MVDLSRLGERVMVKQDSTQDGRHQHGVDILVHKNKVSADLNCEPVSKIKSMRLASNLRNITLIHEYAPTSDFEDFKKKG